MLVVMLTFFFNRNHIKMAKNKNLEGKMTQTVEVLESN